MPTQTGNASTPERYWLRRTVSRAAVYGESGDSEEVKPIHLTQPTLRIFSGRPDVSGHSRDRRVADDVGTPGNGQEPWSGVAPGKAEHHLKFIEAKYLPGVLCRPGSRVLFAG